MSVLRTDCFLSLPHESELLRSRLKVLVEGLGGRALSVTESEGQRLRTEIRSGLANSAILIADLSSAPAAEACAGPRPAIMWEIGFADASGMSAIYLCDKKDRMTNVPSIIAEEHLVEYELHKLDNALAKVKGALEKIMVRQSAPGTSMFRANCYVDRSSCDLEVKYFTASKTIRILELNLDTVQAQAASIIRALERNPGLSVQVLALNPFSEFAEARADQLAELTLAYRRQLFEHIRGTHKALGQAHPERWALRVYDTFPTQIMFQIDDSIFHSIISLGRRSRDMLHFEVQLTQENVETSFEAHFRTLWNRSTNYERWLPQEEKNVKLLLESHPSAPELQVPAHRDRAVQATVRTNPSGM
jgi:hypothetical protein